MLADKFFSPSPFQTHGHFHTHLDGRLVVSNITGPWNKELVASWARQCYPAVKTLAASGPYVGIAVIHESMLCPPDAMRTLRNVVARSASELNCIGHLVVADSTVEGRALVKGNFIEVYQGLVDYGFFDNFDAARAHGLRLLRDAGF